MEDRVKLDIMYDLGIPRGPYPESCRSISLYLALEKLGDGVGGGGWFLLRLRIGRPNQLERSNGYVWQGR